MRFLPVLAVVLLLLDVSVMAPSTLAQEAPAQLEDGQVTGFIASYPAARALAERYDLDRSESRYAGPDASPNEVFSGVVEEMKAVGAYGEFEDLVQEHGFAGAEEWVTAANRIMMAYAVMSAEASQGGGRMDDNVARQLAEARREIERSEMPADRKRMALAQLDAVAGQMKMFEVPEADREAVRPHMAALDRIVDAD